MQKKVMKPAGNGPFPAVIFVVGLGMTMHEWNGSFDEIADRLIAAGFQTIQFAFDIFKEDGAVVELPIFERAQALEDVIRSCEATSIGIIAQSYGAVTAMAADLRGIKSLVLVSGAYFPFESISNVYKERGPINFEGESTLPRSSGENTTVGKEFWIDAKNFDTLKVAGTITIPTFMIHGDKDPLITTEKVQSVFEQIKNTKKQLKVFIGGDHGIGSVPRSMREEFIKDIVDWFAHGGAGML